MRGLHPALGAMVAVLLAACAAQSAAPSATTSAPPTAEPTVAPAASPTESPLATTPLAESFELGATAPPDAIRLELGTCCDLLFVPSQLTAKAGTVTLFLVNPRNEQNPFDHDFHVGTELGQPLASSPVIKNAKAGVLTIEDLPTGDYVYWCAVNNHDDNGMVGALTVTP